MKRNEFVIINLEVDRDGVDGRGEGVEVQE